MQVGVRIPPRPVLFFTIVKQLNRVFSIAVVGHLP